MPVEGPVDRAGARVERVEGAVVGAEVDRRAEPRGFRDRGGGVHVVARLHRPVELAVARVVGVDAPVGVAQEHAPVHHRRRRVEGAAAQQRAFGAARPHAAAVGGGDRLHLARVVAEVQHPVLQRRARLHRPRGVVGPHHAAVAGPERVHEPALRAEVHPAAVHQRRGLARCGQVARPHDPAVAVVKRHHAPAVAPRQHRRVHQPSHRRRRRRRQFTQLFRPEHVPVVLVDRVQHRVIAELEDVIAADHRRELQQRAEVVCPQQTEGRM